MHRHTMRRATRVVATLLVAAAATLASGCASGGRRTDAADRITPPTMLPGARAEWRYPPTPVEGRVLDLRIEVRVDSTGQPDLETLRVTGLGATENRDAAATWLRNARFRPARQGGHAVPGLYQTRVSVEARIQRIGE